MLRESILGLRLVDTDDNDTNEFAFYLKAGGL